MRQRTSFPVVRLAVVLLFASQLATPIHAQSQPPDEVLVRGNPPLTRQMVAQVSAFYSWVLDVRLTEEQLRVIRDDLVGSWSRNDRSEIEGNMSVLELQRDLAQTGPAQVAQVQQQLQSNLLADLRKRPNDPGASWLLGLYDAAHRPVAESHPPLIRAAGPVGDPAAAAVSLAARILAPDNTDDDAAMAVSEAFAWAGIPTYSAAGTGQTRAAIAPAIPMRLFDDEARMLALDARGRRTGHARTTLAELEVLLREFGWAPGGSRPMGDALRRWLTETSYAARRFAAGDESYATGWYPGWTKPDGFVPLFLQAMARGSEKPATSTDWPLSLLEADLVLAAHLRAGESYGAASAVVPDAWGAAEGVLLAASVTPSGAAASLPCSELEDKLGALKPVHLFALNKLTNVPVNKVYEKLGGWMMTKEDLARQQKAFSRGAKLLRLFSQLSMIQLKLDAAPGSQHYSHGDERNTVLFIASVWSSDGLTESGRVVFDCLAVLGMSPVGKVLEGEFPKWRLEWQHSGIAPHARLGEIAASRSAAAEHADQNYFDFRGRFVNYLEQDSEDGWGGTLSVDMQEESEQAHQEGNRLRDGVMRMEVQLQTDSIPISGLLNTLLGDTTGGILDVAVEFYKNVGSPRAFKDVPVTWHEDHPEEDECGCSNLLAS